ncbi:MopE-related protein [Chitinophagales bacterium]|nr:MopE-related protein [Chitinophagales bacterium]
MKKYFLLLITLFIGLAATAQCTDNGNYWNNSWVSCSTSANPNPVRLASHWLLYEFQEPQYIETSHVWNANRSGESIWGADQVFIDYYTPEGAWIELGQFNFPQAPESDSYTGFVGPDFGGVFLAKILVTIVSTHGNASCASIAEFKFDIDQDACYGVIDACEICDGPGQTTYYLDNDNDGLGDAATAVDACAQPSGYVEDNTDPCDNGNLGWSDMHTLFDNNGCLNCHGGGGAGGLKLTTFAEFSLGGNKCGPNITTGTALVDIITMPAYDGCGPAIDLPSMNDRTGGQFDATELAQLQAWISGTAPEICDDFCANFQAEIPYNGIDDDCNSLTKDDDLDGDGFVLANDCDDTNDEINPNENEVPYNGIDDDCNSLTKDDDLDGDGFVLANDCDDTNDEINSDQKEIPYNGMDDDCNSLTKDDDLDGDGFVLANDCDDTNDEINPDATEIENNLVDEDCDGEAQLVASITVKLLLEGAYIGGGSMRSDLVEIDLMPSQQPYNTAPWNYSVLTNVAPINPNSVDWVLIELRSGTPSLTGNPTTTLLETHAGLLQSNGEVTATNGNPIRFINAQLGDSYHLIVRHRNHLDICTANSFVASTNTVVDFRTASSSALGAEQLKDSGDGYTLLYSGDFNSDAVIQTTDFDQWLLDPSILDSYSLTDATLDGVVQTTDFDAWERNKAKIAVAEVVLP